MKDLGYIDLDFYFVIEIEIGLDDNFDVVVLIVWGYVIMSFFVNVVDKII